MAILCQSFFIPFRTHSEKTISILRENILSYYYQTDNFFFPSSANHGPGGETSISSKYKMGMLREMESSSQFIIISLDIYLVLYEVLPSWKVTHFQSNIPLQSVLVCLDFTAFSVGSVHLLTNMK